MDDLVLFRNAYQRRGKREERREPKQKQNEKEHTFSWENDPQMGENDLSEEILHEKH